MILNIILKINFNLSKITYHLKFTIKNYFIIKDNKPNDNYMLEQDNFIIMYNFHLNLLVNLKLNVNLIIKNNLIDQYCITSFNNKNLNFMDLT